MASVKLPKILLGILLLLLVGWVLHLTLGYRLVDLAYEAPSSFVADSLMPGRDTTPRERYYREADLLALRATVLIITAGMVSALLIYHFQGALLLLFSCLASTFVLFLIFEIFPGLIPAARLDSLFGYYAYKVNYLPDRDLGFREKPYNHRVIRDFAGTGFSSRYRIEVQPYTIEWHMDRDGFRNPGEDSRADVIVLGDSYVEYGATAEDTWVGRMERKLAPLRLRNLGKSGYTIAQYILALKRFGLHQQPRLAVMTVYEGNDFSEMRQFLRWRNGAKGELSSAMLKFASDSLVRRYLAAAGAIAGELKQRARAFGELVLDQLSLRRNPTLPIHPDLAVVRLGGETQRKLFIDTLPSVPPAQLLSRAEFRAIRDLLEEFERICRSRDIIPLVVYIPTAAHIYAEYSTPESGSKWLHIRERQITARKNLERAFETIVAHAGLPFVSLSPVFERAAAQGRMLYYPLDAHWNAEGREIAAEHIAAVIRSRLLPVAGNPA